MPVLDECHIRLQSLHLCSHGEQVIASYGDHPSPIVRVCCSCTKSLTAHLIPLVDYCHEHSQLAAPVTAVRRLGLILRQRSPLAAAHSLS